MFEFDPNEVACAYALNGFQGGLVPDVYESVCADSQCPALQAVDPRNLSIERDDFALEIANMDE